MSLKSRTSVADLTGNTESDQSEEARVKFIPREGFERKIIVELIARDLSTGACGILRKLIPSQINQISGFEIDNKFYRKITGDKCKSATSENG